MKSNKLWEKSKGPYIALLIGSLLLFYFAVKDLTAQLSNIDQLKQIQSLNIEGIKSGGLVHELQKERGLSVAFVYSASDSLSAELVEQRRLSDNKLADFQAYVNAQSELPNTEIAPQLAQLRKRIERRTLKAEQIIDSYSLLNKALLDVLGRRASSTETRIVNNRMMAYYYLLKSIEFSGIDRALLTGVLNAGQMSWAQSNTLQQNHSAQVAYLALFELTASQQNRRFLNNIRKQRSFRQAELFLARILDDAEVIQSGGTQVFSVDRWWILSTARIDLMHQLALQLFNQSGKENAEALEQSNQALWFKVLLYILAGLLIYGLLWLWCTSGVRATKHIFEVQRRQSLALEGSGTALWEYNVSNDEFLLSAQWVRMMGLGKLQMLFSADKLAEKTGSQGCLLISKTVRNHLDGGHDFHSEDHQIETGGQIPIWINACSKVTGRSDRGDVLGVVGTFSDISHRKILENSLRESKQRLKFHLVNSPMAIVEWNSHLEVKFWNLAAESIFGYSAEQALGRHCSFIVPSTERALVEQLSQTVGGTVAVTNISQNGQQLQCEWNNTPLLDDNGTVIGIASIVDNLTERKHSEERQQRSQKMEALGNLTGGIAHDFNNMLGVILGYAEMLKMKLAGQPKLLKYAEQICHAGERGAKLTGNLLSFSTKQPGAQKIENINQLIRADADMLHQTLTARIELKLQLAADLWPVKIDGSSFEDMLLNMCINAMHAMPESGQLTITTSNETLEFIDAAKLNLEGEEYVKLSIEDTGCGMSEGVRAQIFDPYFTTKGKGGSGLGLSQVYGFIHGECGAVDVYSQLGAGTCFVLYFPRYKEQRQSTELVENVMKIDVRGSETILVVDDEAPLLELLQNMLQDQGYQVLCAQSGDQALALLAGHRVDLMLTDIIMPKMNGYQLAEQVRKNYPEVLIRMASGFQGGSEIEGSGVAQDEPVIAKPYNANYILTSVRQQLDKVRGAVKL